MIRFSAFLVVVAVGLLVAGVVTSKLLLVYVAIGVSGVALLALGIGAAVKRHELFGKPETAASDVGAPEPVAAQEAAAFQAPQAQPGLAAYSRPSAASPVWEPADPVLGTRRPGRDGPARRRRQCQCRRAQSPGGPSNRQRAFRPRCGGRALGERRPPDGHLPPGRASRSPVAASRSPVAASRSPVAAGCPAVPAGHAGTRYPLGRTARRRIPALFGAGSSPRLASGRLPTSVACIHAPFRRRLPVPGPQRVGTARGLSSGPAPRIGPASPPSSVDLEARLALDLRPGSRLR